MSQKMMAAMEAAPPRRSGRCSCDANQPTSCACPRRISPRPPTSAGDRRARRGPNAGCNSTRGCAQGDYFLNLNVIHGGVDDPDPVFTLRTRYDQWRAHLVGRADAIQSIVGRVKALPADGQTERTLILELHDIDGRRLTHGGAQVDISPHDGVPSLARLVGPVTDLGNGQYNFTLRAGTQAGVDHFDLRVTDTNPGDPTDVVVATLYPPLEIATIDTQLHVGTESLSAASGGRVPLVVDLPAKPRALLARRAHARAGSRLGSPVAAHAQLPPIHASLLFPGPGQPDRSGRAESWPDVPPGLFDSDRFAPGDGFVPDARRRGITNPRIRRRPDG
jgi:hypothetical protein